MKDKTARQMERHFKGVSNHWRVEILMLINKEGSMTLDDIVGNLKTNLKTTADHTKRLFQAGLINKKYNGRVVEHSLSPYGRQFVKFIKSFSTTF